jgi:hypothetical protein
MGSEVLVLGHDSLVDDSAPTPGAVAREVFEHNPHDVHGGVAGRGWTR